MTKGHWTLSAEPHNSTREELTLWENFLDSVEYFHHFNFYNVKGSFADGDKSTYDTESGFKGLAELRSGTLAGVKGTLGIRWSRQNRSDDDEADGWLVSKLEVQGLDLYEAAGPMFSDVVEDAIDEEDRNRLLPATRDEGLIQLVVGVSSGEVELDAAIAGIEALAAQGKYPFDIGNQASVVDIDRDGFDNFLFSSFEGPALLFRNRGDGSFEEISKNVGLDLENLYGAVFADFDNDGDSDVFVTHMGDERGTQYLRNENGRFVVRNDLVDFPLPAWTVPITVADYDNDGLLDVYLGRFVTTPNFMLPALQEAGDAARVPFLSADESREYIEKLTSPEAHPVTAVPGPRNLLLKNLGEGRFTRASDADAVEIFYNTLATAWSDYDLDGDVDLYVTNEAGPNQLMRNRGDGTFADVSNEVTGEVGFGMGASWGDYNNDGRPDMYTTNMYSKSGLRITEQMGSGVGVTQSARGNTLMRNEPGGFVKASGLEPPAALVEAADVAWGGGFADLNNDACLDIYVPAGLATVPRPVATVGDT